MRWCLRGSCSQGCLRWSSRTHPAARRPGRHRPTLTGPYRDHLRKRRAEEPGIAIQRLLREITEPGYQGSRTLLVQYLAQGRAAASQPHLSPRSAARHLLTKAGCPSESVGGMLEACGSAGKGCTFLVAVSSLRQWPALARRRGGCNAIATARHRATLTRGPGSRAAGLAMAFRVIESAHGRWRAVSAPRLVALVRAGAAFTSGKLIEWPGGGTRPAAPAAA